MQQHEAPESADAVEDDAVIEHDEGDTADDDQLDGFQSDLDNVAAALDALDADDLDTAEALAAGLDEEE